jgi:hypothetical protein
MAYRRIGQESLAFSASGRRHLFLDRLGGLLNWTPIEELLGDIHTASKGDAGLTAVGSVQGYVGRGLV